LRDTASFPWNISIFSKDRTTVPKVQTNIEIQPKEIEEAAARDKD
jgi:hypothetical protein